VRYRLALAACAALVLEASVATAQTLPDLGFERRVAPSLEPLEPRRRAPAAPRLRGPDATPARPLRPGPSVDPTVPRVDVDRIVVAGNTRLADELRAIAAPFEDAALSVTDLLTLRDALTRAYVEAGYVTSGAVVPAQDLADGTLRIEIVEGGLDEIVVRGLERLRERYVRARLERAATPPLNVADVERGLQRLLNDPAIERLDARLGPGPARGRAILEVEVEEAPALAARLRIANDRAPSIGGTRFSALVVAPNTTGIGDETRLEVTALEGGPEVAFGYSVPLTTSNLRAFVTASTYRLEVVEPPLDDLDIEAENTALALGLSYPVIDTGEGRLELAANIDRQFTDTTLLGRGVSFAPGAVDGETVVTALRVTADGEWRSPRRALVGRATASFGIDALGATVHGDDRPDGQFATLFAQGLWAERFNAEGRRLIARANLQLADDALLPVEQLAIGGSDTVRGYRTNTLVRDAGWTASLEFREPVANLRLREGEQSPVTGLVEALAFTDSGGGWNVDRPTPGVDSIYSVGLGLRWQPLDLLQLGLDVAVPLRDTRPDGADSLQDYGIHFQVTLRPF